MTGTSTGSPSTGSGGLAAGRVRLVLWQSKFFGYGGIYYEEMNPLINSPAGVKALEVQMAIKDFVPPGIANFGSPEACNAFMNGEAPMVVHWTSTAKLSKDPEASKIVDQIGIAMVPGVADGDTVYRRPALPTGWSAGIPSTATTSRRRPGSWSSICSRTGQRQSP